MFRSPSDATLVSQALEGRNDALETLVERYQKKAHAIARASGVPSGLVEDIVQDAFLEAFRGLPRLRNPARFGPWFLGIVRNLARRHLRSPRARGLAAHLDPEVPPDTTLEKEELNQRIWETASRLPEGIREVVFLYYHEGESVRSVARSLRISASAVKNRLQKGREILRERLWKEMEDYFRRSLPSPSEWRRKGRSVSLFLLLSLPASSKGATALARSSPLVISGSMFAGAFVMKKIVFSFVLTLVFLGGVLVAVHRSTEPPVTGVVERDRTSPAAPAVAADSVPEPPEGRAVTVPPPPVVRQATPALSGVVLHAGGEEASGARVDAFLHSAEGKRARYATEPATTTADATGRFDFPDLSAGTWSLSATAEDGSWGVARGIEAPSSATVTVRLEEPAALEGVVTGRKGAPLAEVTVKASGESRYLPWFPRYRRETITDADGRFAIEGVPSGKYSLRAEKRGWFPESVDAGTGEEVVIRLERGTYVAGRVYLRDRLHPLRRGELRIFQSSPDGYLGYGYTTGPEGEFTSRTLKPGVHTLTFRHQEFQPVTLELELGQERPRDDLEIIFLDGIRVAGTVRNLDAEPLGLVSLSWQEVAAAAAAHRRVRTGPTGRYEVSGLEPGDFRVVAGAYQRREENRTRVEVAEAPFQEIDLTFDVAPAIPVRVLDGTSHPVPGARVLFSSARLDGLSEPTDGDGWTALEALSRKGELRLFAEHETKGTLRATLDLARNRGPLTLYLEPRGRIAGRAVDQDDQPVSGAQILARYMKTPKQGGLAQAKTDEAGRFAFDLPAGRLDIDVLASAGGLRIEGLELLAGEELELGDLGLELDGVIRGRTLGPAGEPLPSVSLSLNGETSRTGNVHASSDRDGSFAVIVPEGTYEIRATRGPLALGAPLTRIRPGGPPLEIRLAARPERGVRGLVLQHGQPVEGARVRFFDLDRERWARSWRSTKTVTDRHGEFELPVPEGRRIIIGAQAPSFAIALSSEVAVPPEGFVEDVTLVARKGENLDVVVEGPGGERVPDARISVRDDGSPPFSAHGMTDERGTWTLRGLPPGRYDLEGRSTTGKLDGRHELEWPSDPKAVTLRLEPKGRRAKS